jgi:hypothetical protein
MYWKVERLRVAGKAGQQVDVFGVESAKFPWVVLSGPCSGLATARLVGLILAIFSRYYLTLIHSR